MDVCPFQIWRRSFRGRFCACAPTQKLGQYLRLPPEDGHGAVSKSAHALCGSKGTAHSNSRLVHEHVCSFAHASLPLTRKFSLHLKAPARCARPLPVCARTARGPRRATEKPGLRPQVRLRGDWSSKEMALCVLRDIWGPQAGPRPGPSRLDFTSSPIGKVPRKLARAELLFVSSLHSINSELFELLTLGALGESLGF